MSRRVEGNYCVSQLHQYGRLDVRVCGILNSRVAGPVPSRHGQNPTTAIQHCLGHSRLRTGTRLDARLGKRILCPRRWYVSSLSWQRPYRLGALTREIVITGWESNAARAMLHDTGKVLGGAHAKPTACKLQRKRCLPRDAEPSFGSSHYFPPLLAVAAAAATGPANLNIKARVDTDINVKCRE